MLFSLSVHRHTWNLATKPKVLAESVFFADFTVTLLFCFLCKFLPIKSFISFQSFEPRHIKNPDHKTDNKNIVFKEKKEDIQEAIKSIV